MTTENIVKVIVTIIGEVLPQLNVNDIRASDRLEALGANSIDRAEIVMMTLESLNLKIPLTEVSGPKNIGELAELLNVKLQSA